MKIEKYILIGLITLFSASCSEDIMDDINRDPSNPPANLVPAKLQITDAIMSSAFSTSSGNYAWNLSSFNEQEVGCGNNQSANIEMRLLAEVASSTTYNNEWNGTYSNINNLRQLIAKCSEGGLDAGKLDLLGMGQTLLALNFGILTDLHGDIPCVEATNADIPQPKLDSQESIYKNSVLGNLNSAIDNLTKAVASKMNNAGTQDIMYKGSPQKWLGAAYALKARYLLHTCYVNKAVWGDVLIAANSAVAAGFEGFDLSVFNGVNTDNPWTAFYWSRFYTGSSTTVTNLMSDRADTRLEVYNVDFFGKNTIGVPGDKAMSETTQVLNAPAWLDNGAASIHLMSKAELYFILAEAKVRASQDYSEDLKTAIQASFDDYYKAAKADLVSADEYYTSLASKLNANPLQEIMVQKYLSQCRDEQIECYNDIRRCSALNETHIKLTNPLNTQDGANRWPLRLPYGNSDVTNNLNVKAAYGDGTYVYTEKIWLYGGTR